MNKQIEQQIKTALLALSKERVEDGHYGEAVRLHQLQSDIVNFDFSQVKAWVEQEQEKGYQASDLSVSARSDYSNQYVFELKNEISGFSKQFSEAVRFLPESDLTKNDMQAVLRLKRQAREGKQSYLRDRFYNNEQEVRGYLNRYHYRFDAISNLELDEQTASYMQSVQDKMKREKAEAAEQREKKRKEAQAGRDRERQAWIDRHGSDCLQKMRAGGYELRMTYEKERTAYEYPSFHVDTGGERFDWEERANPSCESLDTVEGMQTEAEVVWIVRDDEDPYDFTPREAIKIDPDWCRYALIYPLN